MNPFLSNGTRISKYDAQKENGKKKKDNSNYEIERKANIINNHNNGTVND